MKWYERNPGRFTVEKRLLAKYHPGSRIIIEGGKMRVEKTFRTSRNAYLIRACYTDEHPYSAMVVRIVQPPIKGRPPHCFSDGSLCLHDDKDVGPQTTSVVFLDWAVQWVLCYEQWLDKGKWPETNRGMNFRRCNYGRDSYHI
jgi:hypothetical protein